MYYESSNMKLQRRDRAKDNYNYPQDDLQVEQEDGQFLFNGLEQKTTTLPFVTFTTPSLFLFNDKQVLKRFKIH